MSRWKTLTWHTVIRGSSCHWRTLVSMQAGLPLVSRRSFASRQGSLLSTQAYFCFVNRQAGLPFTSRQAGGALACINRVSSAIPNNTVHAGSRRGLSHAKIDDRAGAARSGDGNTSDDRSRQERESWEWQQQQRRWQMDAELESTAGDEENDRRPSNLGAMIPRGVPSLSHGVRSGRKRAVRFDPASGGLDIRGGEECGGDTNEGERREVLADDDTGMRRGGGWRQKNGRGDSPRSFPRSVAHSAVAQERNGRGGGSEGAKGGGVSELHGQRGGGSERRETAAVKRGLNGPGRLSKDAARKSSITFQAVAEQDGDEQDESEAYKMARVEAVRLLSLKQLSEAQLRQKLKSNLTQPERARGLARRAGTRQPRGSMPVEQADAAIDAAVTSMKQLGFVNDTEYAEAFARGRFNRLAWGPARLRMELKKRGLSSRDTNAAMENIYKSSSATEDGFSNSDDIGDFEEHDPSNHVGFSKEAWLTLTAQASRVWSRGSDVPIEKRKQRLVGWLQRRGYNWEQTWKVVNFLQRET